ncbi:MAG: addiction module antidote protein [Steroidobacterales bacterium]
MRPKNTTKPASLIRPYRSANYLRGDGEITEYIQAMLEDGDPRAVPVALRTVADAIGGIAALSKKTGLSRETLNRILSARGHPRFDTLATILAAFGLCLTVQPARKARPRRGVLRADPA